MSLNGLAVALRDVHRKAAAPTNPNTRPSLLSELRRLPLDKLPEESGERDPTALRLLLKPREVVSLGGKCSTPDGHASDASIMA